MKAFTLVAGLALFALTACGAIAPEPVVTTVTTTATATVTATATTTVTATPATTVPTASDSLKAAILETTLNESADKATLCRAYRAYGATWVANNLKQAGMDFSTQVVKTVFDKNC